MKKLKVIMATVSACVFMGFVLAENPSKETTENLANLLVEKLGKDAQLTDSQRVVIKEQTKVFITRMEAADNNSSNAQKAMSKEQIFLQYQSRLDSTLTMEQKVQREIKIKERIQPKMK